MGAKASNGCATRQSRTSGSGRGDQGNPVPYRHRDLAVGCRIREGPGSGPNESFMVGGASQAGILRSRPSRSVEYPPSPVLHCHWVLEACSLPRLRDRRGTRTPEYSQARQGARRDCGRRSTPNSTGKTIEFLCFAGVPIGADRDPMRWQNLREIRSVGAVSIRDPSADSEPLSRRRSRLSTNFHLVQGRS